MKATTIAITFETVTPESAEHGDFAETGFELEPRPYERGDLKAYGRAEFISEPSSYPTIDASTWFTQGQCDQDRAYFERGEETRLSLHLGNVTTASMRRVARYLARKPIFSKP
jgi:hypothetical protein